MNVEVTEAAIRAARDAGLYGNVRAMLARMTRLAAPVTHAAGNFRFEGYLLTIHGGRLVHVVALSPQPHPSPSRRRPRREPKRVFAKATSCAICGGTMRRMIEDPETGQFVRADCEYKIDPGRGRTCDRP